MNFRYRRLLLAYLFAAVTPLATLAETVLQHVPHDAFAFVAINHLAKTDVKATNLLSELGLEYPAPLTFLAAITGIQDGLNPEGDLLVALVPAGDNETKPPRFAVWIPITDYGRMLTSLQATPREGISGVRIADEELLVAQQGNWALFMDPDARDRMESMLAENARHLDIEPWKDWLLASDVVAVLSRGGVQEVVKRPAGKTIGEFLQDDQTAQSPGESLRRVLGDFATWLGRFPELQKALSGADALGVAIRFDDTGNVLASARVAATPHKPWDTDSAEKLPSLAARSDPMMLQGAGMLPAEIVQVAAATHAREMLRQLIEAEQLRVDEKSANEFVAAYQSAAAEIASWSVSLPLGEPTAGLYTNNFLVVRVPAQEVFVDRADAAMQLWNKIHRDSDRGNRLVFDIDEPKFGDRTARHYSIDVASLEGMPALPGIRQLMEKFFGPGGKLQMFIVPMDEQTVLLAASTPEQVTKAIDLLDRKQAADWSGAPLQPALALLPPDAAARVFFSPYVYEQWKEREFMAVADGAVFGAPDRKIPESPDVGIAAKVRDNEIQLDAAVPLETIRALGTRFKPQ